MTVIWLDDLRDPTKKPWCDIVRALQPEAEVRWVKTVNQFKEAFCELSAKGQVGAVCFDNDLGGYPSGGRRALEGRDAFNWMDAYVRKYNLGRFSLFAQSSNTAVPFDDAFRSLRLFWYNQCE